MSQPCLPSCTFRKAIATQFGLGMTLVEKIAAVEIRRNRIRASLFAERAALPMRINSGRRSQGIYFPWLQQNRLGIMFSKIARKNISKVHKLSSQQTEYYDRSCDGLIVVPVCLQRAMRNFRSRSMRRSNKAHHYPCGIAFLGRRAGNVTVAEISSGLQAAGSSPHRPA